MPQPITDLYLYLTRRDKTGVRIIAKLKSQPQIAVRIENLNSFNLPMGWSDQIDQIIYDSRLLWEPWVESSSSYDELRADLKLRGYSNVPLNPRPEFTPSVTQTPLVNVAHLPLKTTMLRKQP